MALSLLAVHASTDFDPSTIPDILKYLTDAVVIILNLIGLFRKKPK